MPLRTDEMDRGGTPILAGEVPREPSRKEEFGKSKEGGELFDEGWSSYWLRGNRSGKKEKKTREVWGPGKGASPGCLVF